MEMRENYLCFLLELRIILDPQAVLYISFGKGHRSQSLVNSNRFKIIKLNDSELSTDQLVNIYSQNVKDFIKSISFNITLEEVLTSGRCSLTKDF